MAGRSESAHGPGNRPLAPFSENGRSRCHSLRGKLKVSWVWKPKTSVYHLWERSASRTKMLTWSMDTGLVAMSLSPGGAVDLADCIARAPRRPLTPATRSRHPAETRGAGAG